MKISDIMRYQFKSIYSFISISRRNESYNYECTLLAPVMLLDKGKQCRAYYDFEQRAVYTMTVNQIVSYRSIVFSNWNIFDGPKTVALMQPFKDVRLKSHKLPAYVVEMIEQAILEVYWSSTIEIFDYDETKNKMYTTVKFGRYSDYQLMYHAKFAPLLSRYHYQIKE